MRRFDATSQDTMSASLYLRLVGLALLGALTTGRPLVDKRSSNTTISLRETQGSFSLARRQETGLSGGPQVRSIEGRIPELQLTHGSTSLISPSVVLRLV